MKKHSCDSRSRTCFLDPWFWLPWWRFLRSKAQGASGRRDLALRSHSARGQTSGGALTAYAQAAASNISSPRLPLSPGRWISTPGSAISNWLSFKLDGNSGDKLGAPRALGLIVRSLLFDAAQYQAQGMLC